MPGITIWRRRSTKASTRCITCRFQRTCSRISSTSSTTRATWFTPRTHRSRCCTTTSPVSYAEPAISLIEIRSQPLLNFFVEVAAVLGLQDPMPGVGPYQQAAWHLHALQRAPIFQRIVDGHAKIALSDAEQHGGFPVGRVGYRALITPHRVSLPRRAAVRKFAAVDSVAGAPLSGEIDLAGVAHDAAVAGAGRFDPVGQVSAVTRACGAHAGRIDVRIALDGLIHRLIDLVARRFQRVELDRLRKLLAETGRTSVVGHQHYVAWRREQVIVPAQSDLIRVVARRTAVD